MDNMVAVVTGGTGGIGTEICRALSRNFHVVACYFKNGRHEEAKTWQSQQKSAGFDFDIVYGDVAKFADCEQIVHSIQERYGRIDVLVNNAGVTRDTSFKKMSESQWHEVMDANLHSTFNMTRNVLPLMLEHSFGRIINISSINGRKGQFGQCNYAATKSALYGFGKSLALEVAAKGITVNSISPGYIATPMVEAMKPEVLDKIVAAIPVGRLGKPEEIAEAVAFIASPAAAFMTGANLDMNGGQYM
ncbi:MAG: acetoacetyl-CoA reductase [Legionellaceae bacterium]|nr:acetoacetyl-CoA reductase [Legionellaceae bacterium]